MKGEGEGGVEGLDRGEERSIMTPLCGGTGVGWTGARTERRPGPVSLGRSLDQLVIDEFGTRCCEQRG